MSAFEARSDWAVEADGLVKVFGTNRAVDGVDLRVPTGSIYGVLGPNGAGKTTTIAMLATLLRPDGGTGRIFGHDVQREPQIVRQLIGVTGQYASVDETLSATENLVLFSRLLGLSRAEAKAKSAALLEEFGLTEAARRPLKNFSGGMRRRLDLAASLIAQPPLIFLDEPTTGLDPRTRAQMWDTIRRLVATGSTVLLTTQYLDEADQLADRIPARDLRRAEQASLGWSSCMGASLRNPDRERIPAHRVQAERRRIASSSAASSTIGLPFIDDEAAACRQICGYCSALTPISATVGTPSSRTVSASQSSNAPTPAVPESSSPASA